MAKPIFCLTHPRACSTAFERVFMTRQDLSCWHEPFGDAFYFGPERLSSRFEGDETARQQSGFADSTYASILEQLANNDQEGKRVFIKDMGYYLIPPHGQPAQIAPSLARKERGIGTTTNGTPARVTNGSTAAHAPYPYGTYPEPHNPTIIPAAILHRFMFTFLIRDPHSSVPSYYRCTVPPLDEVTGFFNYDPSEAGYVEMRQMLDYLVASGQVGPDATPKARAQTHGDAASPIDICLIDADDLLDDPEGIIQAYCHAIGLVYSPSMLSWDTDQAQNEAKVAFEKWKGWHEDALDSKDLKPRKHGKKVKSEAEWDAEWQEKYGQQAAKLIRDTVDSNMDHYLYLKQFALVPSATPTA